MASRAERGEPPLAHELARGAPDYPASLLDLADPPDRLFVRGTFVSGTPVVAIVGSRAATSYGLGVARRLAADLAAAGVAVVSGLAHGVDAAAHRGALDAAGRTVAVLPGGLDAITPRGHAALATEIAVRGALLTEHASGPPLYKGSFLERNRLIAALGAAVVVVEAAETSGALNTAAHALRLGRPLLAVPGDIDRVTSRGTHQLLREGARVCEGARDVLEALATSASPAPAARATSPVASAHADAGPGGSAPRILAALEAAALTAEGCAAASGLALEETLEHLLRLEWAGLVSAAPGGRWRRRPGSR